MRTMGGSAAAGGYFSCTAPGAEWGYLVLTVPSYLQLSNVPSRALGIVLIVMILLEVRAPLGPALVASLRRECAGDGILWITSL